MKKIIFLLISLQLLPLAYNAQTSFKKKFKEVNLLLEEKLYLVALPLLHDLIEKEPTNFNLNYKIGICYLNTTSQQAEALPYLMEAAQNTYDNYNPYSTSEKKSPIETFFYLGKAHHLNYEFDAAILNYNTFKSKITKKHILYNEVDYCINQSINAKKAVANPIKTIVKNIGKPINSEYEDYSPLISIDESTIYFTSRRLRKDSSNYYLKDEFDSKYFEDIYMSQNENGVWQEPILLNINNSGHLATINISSDGKTLYVYKSDNGDGNIYKTTKDDDENWSSLEKLGPTINSKFKESHAHITPDGNTLYFVSNIKKNGVSDQDIYFSKKLPNGDWGTAKNAGNILNTPYDEDGVFLHPDGKTIYFSSKGHNSMGGYDIFYSILDENGNWKAPTNMGYPINTPFDDVFLVTSTDGKRAYYSSFHNKGYGGKDIYITTLIDATEKPLTLLKGVMRNTGKESLSDNAHVIVTDNTTGKMIGKYTPRKRDGKFFLILKPDGDYHVKYISDGYTKEEDIYISPDSVYNEINRGINMKEIVFGEEDSNTELASVSSSEIQKDENISALKVEITKLKSKVKKLEAQLKTNALIQNSSTDDFINNNFNEIGAYKEFFNYNVSKINLNNNGYQELILKAIAQYKLTGSITIEIESSASNVPTKTFGSNAKLAYKRAKDTEAIIINSLIEKGIDRNKITIKTPLTKVSGPAYNGNYEDAELYQKYQYVVVKIK